jgi:hypothetical protein
MEHDGTGREASSAVENLFSLIVVLMNTTGQSLSKQIFQAVHSGSHSSELDFPY